MIRVFFSLFTIQQSKAVYTNESKLDSLSEERIGCDLLPFVQIPIPKSILQQISPIFVTVYIAFLTTSKIDNYRQTTLSFVISL